MMNWKIDDQYVIIHHGAVKLSIAFKIHNEKFVICMYFDDSHRYPQYHSCVCKKLLCTTVLKDLIKRSNYLVLLDNISNYVFGGLKRDSKDWNINAVEITNNTELIKNILTIRKQLREFNYNKDLDLKTQTKELYRKIWKDEN